ncbi:MAG: apolipoprotein N-acyltransferase [Gammaproteobacteria bacterium]|nr:apolipoprotein N-acyltransferase [Gammaproteobacteria bacterium]
MNDFAIWIRGWRGDALVLLAGLVIPFAFAPWSIYPLAIFGVALFMLTLWQTSSKRAFWRGWIFGLAMFAIGVSWVHVSMHRFGGVGIPLSMFITALFVMFLALFTAASAWMTQKLFSKTAQSVYFYALLLFPMNWMLWEWVRSWIFTGFPWLSIGYSQIDSALSGYAPLWGVFSISLAVIWSAGALFCLIMLPSSKRYVIPAVLVLWLLPFGLNQLQWSDQEERSLQVSLIQGNIDQNMKWRPEQRLPTLELYARLSRENWGKDLIIWPETAIPAFYHQAKAYIGSLGQEARMNGSELLIGLPIYDQSSKRYFNSVASVGAHEDFYEKRHLVPFGEYLPLPSLYGWFIETFDIPMSDFSPGVSEQSTLRVASTEVGVTICYEDLFGNEVIEALPAAKFLVNVSNDAWFGDSMAPHQHLEIARMRAKETARYLVRATNTGVSAIINEKGDVLATSPQFTTHVLSGEVQLRSGLTPFAVYGNLPFVGLLFLALILATVFERRARKD